MKTNQDHNQLNSIRKDIIKCRKQKMLTGGALQETWKEWEWLNKMTGKKWCENDVYQRTVILQQDVTALLQPAY